MKETSILPYSPNNLGFTLEHFRRRLTDVISEAIVEVFYGKHADAVKEESANALGKVGFILADHAAEFDKWYKWLWNDFAVSKKENAQNLYLRSLAAMLRLKPRFGDHVVHMVSTRSMVYEGL